VEAAAHAGLLLSSYLRDQDDDGSARRELLTNAIKACGRAGSVYRDAFARWAKAAGQGAVAETVRVVGRAVLGLGAESPLETGLTLHHTYGTPFIPGSALKGLAAHYCDQVWGAVRPEFKKDEDAFKTLFGTTEDSGHLIFTDAWVTPDSLAESLVLDVMTVHHPKYYQPVQPEAPSDFDDPTPIPFLSIQGEFRLFVKCDVPGTDGEEWARLAMGLLLEALDRWGVGGKTAVGYGRMVRVESTGGRGVSAPSAFGTIQGRTGPLRQQQPASTPVTPPCRVNAQVDAVLSEKKTKRGGWIAVYTAGGRSWEGPIQNHDLVPGDKRPGDMVRLEVAFVKPGEIAFRWPRPR